MFEKELTMNELTHINERGEAHMVDVGAKAETQRTATAEGFVRMAPETLAMIMEGRAAKGDVLACARIAGIMGSKRTSDLIPMCHPLNITSSTVDLTPCAPGEHPDGRVGIYLHATLGVTGKTGIEMEALTAVSVACLTIYDMCKAVDRGMEITDIRLLHKAGGKSGTWERKS
jgi:cyclic pyranopterin phosphate synthase